MKELMGPQKNQKAPVPFTRERKSDVATKVTSCTKRRLLKP